MRATKTLSAFKHILVSVSITRIPFISLSSLIDCASGTINNAKRTGLKGHPWQHPLSSETDLARLPFILILAVGEWYI